MDGHQFHPRYKIFLWSKHQNQSSQSSPLLCLLITLHQFNDPRQHARQQLPPEQLEQHLVEEPLVHGEGVLALLVLEAVQLQVAVKERGVAEVFQDEGLVRGVDLGKRDGLVFFNTEEYI